MNPQHHRKRYRKVSWPIQRAWAANKKFMLISNRI